VNNQRCFIIAEAGVNHDGDVDAAKALIDVAADAGADAVKFQTFSAKRLATAAAPKAAYQLKNTEAAESQVAMLQRLELSDDAHRMLQAHAKQRGIVFISTPFDEVAADFLESLDIPLFKIPSGELTNTPFLAHVAKKGRPLILSTGMATLGEVETAVAVVRSAGCTDLTVLHCTSNYPASIDDVNLRAMQTMGAALGVKVGYSDHTLGIEVSLAAVALGAAVVEKHFTLSKLRTGPDHAASLEPAELAALVHGIRTVERALGDGVKAPKAAEREVAQVARKSVVASRAIAAGAVLVADDLVMRRPGTGLSAQFLPLLVGRVVRRAVDEGELLSLEVIG
jgi:N,N'-diacetyllegionaminate synthase